MKLKKNTKLFAALSFPIGIWRFLYRRNRHQIPIPAISKSSNSDWKRQSCKYLCMYALEFDLLDDWSWRCVHGAVLFGRGSFLWLGCFIFVAFNFVANEVVALIKPQNNKKMLFCGWQPQNSANRSPLCGCHVGSHVCHCRARALDSGFFFFPFFQVQWNWLMNCVRSHWDRTQFFFNDAVFDRFESDRKQHHDMARSWFHERAISLRFAPIQ